MPIPLSKLMSVKRIPDGYHTLTPYLVLKGGVQALEFYQRASGARELFRMEMPGGGLGHAEIQIGDSRLMLSDENPGMGFVGPQTLGGSPIGLLLYVENVDEIFKQAVAAGAVVERSVANQFYGDRSGTLKDPFGHHWTISTHVEDVAPDELARRAREHHKNCIEQTA
jgi:PhnB protein